MKIVFNNTEPIYQQIINYFLHAVARQEYKPGEKLPSVRELAALFKVNPNTIVRVYQVLEQDGYLEKHRGLGTFLSEDSAKWDSLKEDLALKASEEFLNTMSELGFPEKQASCFLEKYLQRRN